MKPIDSFWRLGVRRVVVGFVVLVVVGCAPNTGGTPAPTCSVPVEFRAYEPAGYDKEGDLIVYCVWDQQALDEFDRKANEARDEWLNDSPY